MNIFRSILTLLAVSLLGGLSVGCDDGGGPPALPPQEDGALPADVGVGVLQITSPADGVTLSALDDLDGDLSNGLQIRVGVVSTNETAEIEVSGFGGDPVSGTAVEGRLSLDVTLNADENANYRIVASTRDDEGNTAEDSVTVQVRTGRCDLRVFPQPRGVGCDLGADADEDPNAVGLQTTLRAETNCDEVTFTVNNLPSQPVTAENGEASLAVTLRDGENTITVSVTDGIVDPVVVGPYPLNVSTSGPSIQFTGLSDTRPNVLLLDAAEQQGGQVYWTLSGTASGITPGGALAVTTEPALDGAPAEVTVDDDGRFSLELALAEGAYFGGTISLSGTDACGVSGDSAAYSIQLDGVIPESNIVSPTDGQLLIFAQDVDPLRAGAQIPVTIELTDPRPAEVDYAITVECAAVGGAPAFVDRARQNGDAIRRSDLLDDRDDNDQIIVTFQQSEAGEFICRVALADGSNPMLASETVWRTFFERPNFSLVSPDRAPSCISSDSVELFGLGESLDGNQPALSVVVTPAGGEPGAAIALDPQGGERYGYTFTPQTLPDGEYSLTVTGTVRGDVPVEVSPETLDILVDRVAPTLVFTSPAADGVFQDVEPITPGTQSRISLEACGVAGESLTIDSVPALPGFPQIVEVPADGECAQIVLNPVTVPLGPVALQASVTDRCSITADANLIAEIPAENTEARITSPQAGSSVNITFDNDAVRAGCQIEIEAIGQGLGEGATFDVCTTFEQGGNAGSCINGARSALDGACRITGATPSGSLVACPVTLQQGTHQLSFVGIFGNRVDSAPVDLVVDCEAPSVAAVSIVQDADSDGCINQQERTNTGAASGTARVSVQVETVGIEDGQNIRILSESGAILASGPVNGNTATIAVELSDGARRVYATGADAVGNPLPSEGAGFVDASIQVDTVPPTPGLVNVNDAACLNALVDQDPQAEDLQFGVQISTGRQADEQITARMLIDGVVNGLAIDTADNILFPAVTMAQGQRSLTVIVSDACSNVGSVSGFAELNGQPDWSSPLSTSVIVDTLAPGLALGGVNAGAQLAAEDDVDADSSNGFQLDLTATLSPFSALDAGQSIDVQINGVPATTSPSPLTVPDNLAGPIPVRVTLSPGDQNIGLRATDTCGNEGVSEVVPVRLNVDGCTSQITSFDQNPAVLGPDAAAQDGNALLLTVSGNVDLLDATCAGANVQLIVDGNPVAGTNIDPDGSVTFAGVRLVEGQHTLRFRVQGDEGGSVESAVQAVSIDLSSPVVAIVQPLANATVLTDSNAQLDGQQALVQVDVTEATVVTERSATLEVDGNQVGGQLNLAAASPVTVTFPDVTLAAGTRTFRVCVTDSATNSSCAQWTVNADPAAPAALADLTATVIDPRSSEVRMNFTAPGDDGAGGGPVTGYEIRRSSSAFTNETDWDNAASTRLVVDPDTAPAAPTELTVSGTGGPSIGDGLAINERHFVAARAVDDAGRLGGLVEVEVDLRLGQLVVGFAPTTPPWSDAAAFNTTSPVIGLGDVDGDGFNDILVTRAQGAGETVASVIFGGPADEQPSTLTLGRTPGTSASFFGAGGGSVGDVNGDGAPDFAVLGFTADVSAGTASLYFGCPDQCDRNTIAAPDVQITGQAGRLLSVVTSAGNFNQRAGDAQPINDLFVGGSISAASQHQTSFVVAGRAAWPAEIQLDEDPALGGDGVAVLSIPDAKAGNAASSVGDIDGDGFGDVAFSAGNPNIVYIFGGGADREGVIAYDANNPLTRALTDPCTDPDGFGVNIVGGIDLDGDAQGRPDFAIGDGINRRINVFDNALNSLDCFGRSRSLFGARFDLAGDIDGDGSVDIISGHNDDNTDAFIFYNDGQGQFGYGAVESPRGYHVLIDGTGLTYQGVAGIGDFDGDGRDDFAVAVKQPGAGNLEVIIYY